LKEVELVVRNEMGIHIRSASKLSKVASRFQSEVYVAYGGVEVNAKSVLGVIGLAAEAGAVIKVKADGADEDAVLAAIRELVDGRFDGEP